MGKLFFFLGLSLTLYSTDIAITLDDYPLSNTSLFSTEERTSAFLKALSFHECKAVFFCIGENCKKLGSSSLALVNNEGHFLANHTLKHLHLSGQPLKDWESEVKNTEKLLSPYKNMRKWFRYPFLDYGDRVSIGGSQRKMRESRKKLKQLGYVEGYVTINTFDWHIDYRLKKAIKEGKIVDYPALKKLYVNLIQNWCEYYVDLYQSKFSEKVIHTLLLHANDLNALFLKDILQMIKDSKWNLVSPEKAFENPSWREKVYKLEFIGNKPKTLDLEEIDQLMDKNRVFKETEDQNPQI